MIEAYFIPDYTKFCMDFTCECGSRTHFHEKEVTHVRCAQCLRSYAIRILLDDGEPFDAEESITKETDW